MGVAVAHHRFRNPWTLEAVRAAFAARGCTLLEVRLNAHHVENYSSVVELRLDIDNGVTLCKPCHVAFHCTFGFTGNGREQLDLYLGSRA